MYFAQTIRHQEGHIKCSRLATEVFVGCLQDMAGSLQSLCWGSAAVGGVMSAYFSGSLVDAWGPRGVFAATAVFPLIVSVAALLISEKPTSLVPGGGITFRNTLSLIEVQYIGCM